MQQTLIQFHYSTQPRFWYVKGFRVHLLHSLRVHCLYEEARFCEFSLYNSLLLNNSPELAKQCWQCSIMTVEYIGFNCFIENANKYAHFHRNNDKM